MNTDRLRGEVLHLEDDFGISFQDVDGMANVHCEVNNWSRSVHRRIIQTVDKLQREHRRDAYGIALRSDEKHQKWLRLMGFERYQNKWILDDNGEDAIVSIYIRKYHDHNRTGTQ